MASKPKLPSCGLGAAGGAVLAAYLWSPRSLLRPSLRGLQLRWALFADILRVGLVGTVSTLATNLAIGASWSSLPTYWQQLLGTVDALNKKRPLPLC